MTITSPVPFALDLARSHLLGLVDEPELAGDIDRLPATFVAFGTDQPDAADSGRRFLDPSMVIAALSRHFNQSTLVLAGSADVDHPYNLARRGASLHNLTQHRGGVAVTAPSDGSVARLPGQESRLGASPAETLSAAIAAIRGLWLTWPEEAIVADFESGIFTRTEDLLRINHDDLFDIAGPLNVPVSLRRQPLLVAIGEIRRDTRPAVDVVIADIADIDERDDTPRAPARYISVDLATHPSIDAVSVAIRQAPHADGVLLRAAPADDPLHHTVRDLIPALLRENVLSSADPLVGTDWTALRSAYARRASPAFEIPSPAV